MKKVLILGGTGAMGKALVELLDKSKYEIYVTSRKQKKKDDVIYLQGNAHDLVFLESVLNLYKWDSIVDFMVYQTSEFETIVSTILPKTNQYIFISSARVYAPTNTLITENTPRLLDVCEDIEYILTSEYALAKAREENQLISSGYGNWTIVRPSLTYNDNRLQFALWEKEEWLYRALKGRSIIFPKSMIDVKTTMSYGYDVSVVLSKLICNKKALGETVHIAGAKAATWGEILQIYCKAIKEATGKDVKVCYIDDWQEISHKCNRFYQAKYARAVNREFSSQKLMNLIGKIEFVSPEEGLKICIGRFLDNGSNFKDINWKTEAFCDQITGEKTSLKEFGSLKRKIAYILARYFLILIKK